MIQLGTKISLEGFDETDPARLVVIKKMVGSLAKKIEETKGAYEKLDIAKTGNTVKVKVAFADNTSEATAEHENIFFALSNAFQQLA